MKNHALKCSTNPCTCDGYHTFQELYNHRIALFIALCRAIEEQNYWIDYGGHNTTINRVPWRSKYHSDGTLIFGGEWFVLGVGTENGKQITYHLPIYDWENTKFAKTLDKAPDWDGHTSDDVLERLKNL